MVMQWFFDLSENEFGFTMHLVGYYLLRYFSVPNDSYLYVHFFPNLARPIAGIRDYMFFKYDNFSKI